MQKSQHSQPRQLSLGISLADDATFANFYTQDGSSADQICQALNSLFTEPHEHSVFVWGASGSGLSHLLQASCHKAEQQQMSCQYLPMEELVGFAPEALLDGLENLDLVCIDGLHCVVGQAHWEQALFNFFNRSKDAGQRLVMAADASPTELAVQLADLKSRLAWGLVFQLPAMDDVEKQRALQKRAQDRGLELSEEVAQFILHRAPRHSGALFDCLNQLDSASLAEQRKLTIPFVKQVLGY